MGDCYKLAKKNRKISRSSRCSTGVMISDDGKGVTIGRNSRLHHGVEVGKDVIMGRNVHVGQFTWIKREIYIPDNTCIEEKVDMTTLNEKIKRGYAVGYAGRHKAKLLKPKGRDTVFVLRSGRCKEMKL